MRVLLEKQGLKTPLTTLHNFYTYTTLCEWMDIFHKTPIRIGLAQNTYDCVARSMERMIEAFRVYGLNSIGMVLGNYKGTNHAWNIFYTTDGWCCFEPTILTGKNIFSLDDKDYKIGSVAI